MASALAGVAMVYTAAFRSTKVAGASRGREAGRQASITRRHGRERGIGKAVSGCGVLREQGTGKGVGIAKGRVQAGARGRRVTDCCRRACPRSTRMGASNPVRVG